MPATLSAVTVCAASSISSAEAMRSSGTSSSFTASVFSSAVGNPQWPSPMGLGQRERDPGAHPDHRGLLDAESFRDQIGGTEADAPDVAGPSR